LGKGTGIGKRMVSNKGGVVGDGGGVGRWERGKTSVSRNRAATRNGEKE